MYPGDIVSLILGLLNKTFILCLKGKADAKMSEGFDALYIGVEISSGGQRIHLPELLIQRLKMKDLILKILSLTLIRLNMGLLLMLVGVGWKEL